MDDVSDQTVANIPLAKLLAAQSEWETIASKAKVSLEIIRAELTSRVAVDLDSTVEEAQRQGGTFHFVHDNILLTAVIDKKVEWDSAKLLPVAGAMDWAIVQKIFKIEFSVPEKVYSVLPAAMSISDEQQVLFKQIEAARTVKYGRPKIAARKPA